MELVCIVHARPNAQVVWSKNSNPIEDPGHIEEQDKGHRHSLQINVVTETDFGEYSCEATNEYGTSSASIHLTGRRKRNHLLWFIYAQYGILLILSQHEFPKSEVCENING